jgi:predicted helicase
MVITPEVWGPYGWKFMHFVALAYPQKPTADDKKNYKTFFESIQNILPCALCSNNYKKHLLELPLTDSVLESNVNLIRALYRPFTKVWFYYSRDLNHSVSLMPSIFPTDDAANRVICISGIGIAKNFSALIVDKLPDYQFQPNGQCFPLYVYDTSKKIGNDLFGEINELPKVNSVSDDGLKHFLDAYAGANISKEDLFYYIYGLLHSDEYKIRFQDNLSKELPRIPVVKKFEDFQKFCYAGRQLAELHLNYETVHPYPVNIDGGESLLSTFSDSDYQATQMKFASKSDKSTVIYNQKITIKDIPLDAYEYVVNGKPALEWVMERQSVTTHKDSGIVNDANLWATETIGYAAYPLKLFQRVITVSLETMKIIRSLPKLEIA